MAGRLAENPNVNVLVIEAGMGNPEDVDAITTPVRAFELRGSKYDWQYKTTMVDRPEYTRIEKPNTRGKVLGGSSCLNYYTWIPGSAATFDDWSEFGGEEWTWNNVKDYLYKVRSDRLFRKRHILTLSSLRNTTMTVEFTARICSTLARTDRSRSRTRT